MHKRAVAAVALLGLVIVATLAIIVSRQDQTPQPPPQPTPPAPATMIVQVRDSTLLAQGSVLMGINGESTRLDQLWWTTDWWVDQIDVQEVSAAELGRKPVQYVMQTVQAQVQVPVNDAWVLDRLAFAGLIDAVGGVRLNLTQRAAYVDEQGVPQFLDAGPQTLAGAHAADYVLDPSLRDTAVRMARFQAVWDQVLRRFPTDPEKSRALMVSLGVLSKATMTTDELADFMAQAKQLRVTSAYGQAEVPLDPGNLVRIQPAQGVRTAYALSAADMPSRMAGIFEEYPSPAEPIARVAAAAFRSEDVTAIRDQLTTRGWQTAWAGRSEAGESSLIVPPGTSAQQVTQLQQAVGLTPQEQDLPWGDAQVDIARAVGS
ncbi:MAG: LCP family protein [Candidatus Nanopelagicales bacterium]